MNSRGGIIRSLSNSHLWSLESIDIFKRVSGYKDATGTGVPRPREEVLEVSDPPQRHWLTTGGDAQAGEFRMGHSEYPRLENSID